MRSALLLVPWWARLLPTLLVAWRHIHEKNVHGLWWPLILGMMWVMNLGDGHVELSSGKRLLSLELKRKKKALKIITPEDTR